MQAYWSNTVHAVLLLATSTAVLGLLPFLYFGCHWYWQRCHAQQAKPAPAATADAPASGTAPAVIPAIQPQAGEPAYTEDELMLHSVNLQIMLMQPCQLLCPAPQPCM